MSLVGIVCSPFRIISCSVINLHVSTQSFSPARRVAYSIRATSAASPPSTIARSRSAAPTTCAFTLTQPTSTQTAKRGYANPSLKRLQHTSARAEASFQRSADTQRRIAAACAMRRVLSVMPPGWLGSVARHARAVSAHTWGSIEPLSLLACREVWCMPVPAAALPSTVAHSRSATPTGRCAITVTQPHKHPHRRERLRKSLA